MLGINLKLSNLTSIIRAASQRLFMTGDGSTSFAEYSAPFVPTTNYNLECKFSNTVFGVQQGLINLNTATVSEELQLIITTAGHLKINTIGHTPGEGTTVVTDGEFHEAIAKINVVTGVIDVFLNGVFEFTTTHNNVSLLLKSFNVIIWAQQANTASSVTAFFKGVIADFKLTNDPDGTPTTLTQPLNTPLPQLFELPLENVFGSDVVLNGEFNVDAVWVKQGTSTISGGVYNASGLTPFGHLVYQTGSITTTGKVYEVTYEIVTNNNGGGVAARLRGNVGAVNSSVGVHRDVVVAGAGDTLSGLVAFTATAFDGQVDNITMREITNALELNNLDDREVLTLDFDSGDWNGADVSKGAYALSDPAVTQSGFTFSFDGTQAGSVFATSPNQLLVDAVYEFDITIKNYSAGGYRNIAGSTFGALRTSNGNFVETIIASADEITLSGDVNLLADVTINSVRRVLEVP